MCARKVRQRESVYVVGAGFSAGLGYPLTSDLLFRVWGRLDRSLRRDLKRVIAFHHPTFEPDRFASYPNIEQVLSEMLINEKLFKASRHYEGNFTLQELRDLQRDLLLRIGDWFHDLSKKIDWNPGNGGWLHRFREIVFEENAVIVSFNWDLVLDRLLFGEDLGKYSYRLGGGQRSVLLKPHGSLNWFEGKTGRFLKGTKREEIFGRNGKTQVYAFLPYRAPVSKKERIYTPLIVPPVHLKEFDMPIFTSLWKQTVTVLSRAKRVVFLGYSMPSTDLHVQFIMRCGFHNQAEGIPAKGRTRTRATGLAEVVIVNPDQAAAKRIAAVVGPNHHCQWFSSPVSDWVVTADGG